jgi:hypothetical protein
VRKADNLATFLCRFVLKSGSLNLLELSGPVKGGNGIALTLPFIHSVMAANTQQIWRNIENITLKDGSYKYSYVRGIIIILLERKWLVNPASKAFATQLVEFMF